MEKLVFCGAGGVGYMGIPLEAAKPLQMVNFSLMIGNLSLQVTNMSLLLSEFVTCT